MLRTVAFSAASLLLIWCACHRIMAYRATRRPETSYLAAALLSMGLAFALNIAPVALWLDQSVWRLPNLSIMVSHLLTIGTAWAAIEMVSFVTGWSRHSRQIRAVLFLAGGIGMVVTYLTAHPSPEAPLFFEQFAHDRRLIGYWNLFGGTLTAATGYLAVAAWGDSRRQPGSMRHSLVLIAVGAALECIFIATRLVATWVNVPSWSNPIALVIVTVGAFALGSGALLPNLAAGRRHRQAQRRLLTIWEVVTSTCPHVREAPMPRSTYRTLIEIQDALVETRGQDSLRTALIERLEAVPARPIDEVDDLVDDLLAAADDWTRLRPT